MKILDGTYLAKKVKNDIKATINQLTNSKTLDNPKFKSSSNKITLGIIIVGDNPASQRYVKLKQKDCTEVGINTKVLTLPSNTTYQTLIYNLANFNADKDISAYIIQLPLPRNIKPFDILGHINPLKDADSLSLINLGSLLANIEGDNLSTMPCTPQAVLDIAEHYKISFENKKTLIIGRGLTVGRYLPTILSNKKYNSTVTQAHSKTENLDKLIKTSDIIISAAGKPSIINADNIKSGAILFDIGITYKHNKIHGDVDKNVANKAAALAPNPGGVGPMTRANLLKNTVALKILSDNFDKG
jgi:methylenetetrahydrofolate dehydrogenase (NADP+)/methenyltetrahydrofolate cyclohydrolase